MPELPEVDIIKQSLKKTILHKKIRKVLINNKNLRFKLDSTFEKNINKTKVLNVTRKAKYLVINLDNNKFLLMHFGMSGTLHLVRNINNRNTNLSFYKDLKLLIKHNHVEIFFSKFKLVYNDPRRFGFIKIIDNLEKLKLYFKRLGPEPPERRFNLNYIQVKFKHIKKNIKSTLLDQNIISGLGNIYVNEILFSAGIIPTKKTHNLKLKNLKDLIIFSKKILKNAIKKGGSSIRDFQNTSGNKGKFQDEFKVYGKENTICPRKNCTGKITKIFISNRSTFYCKLCQK